jgi:hypothetical protein
MGRETSIHLEGEKDELELRCLGLICEIAGRGVRSRNRGYALQELFRVLREWTGQEATLVEADPEIQTNRIIELNEELDLIKFSQQLMMTAPSRPN